jgi:hypothetical protein
MPVLLKFMAKPRKSSETESVNSFRFSLAGLIIFILILMAGTALISHRLFDTKPKQFSFAKNDLPERGKSDISPSPDAAPGDEDSAARCPYLD